MAQEMTGNENIGKEELARRPIRSFVLRQGRLTHAQQRALDELMPVFGVPYAPVILDLDSLFGREGSPKVLEIGFGMGDSTAKIAQSQPECDFIGVEVHTPGVGSLLKQIGELQLNNLRIIQHDAVEVLQHMIADASLDGVHIFFPDPWHKKRHHKRRLIQAAFVKLLCSKMKAGAYLHVATDWQEYAEWVLDILQQEPLLENTAQSYAPKPDYRPLTKFENRGIKLGHGVWDIIFRRK
ncbi:tRNA (guanosine(46)-N7)-methyltransferase TrmB [Methylobacillus flagellatus]|uniref:tRNA (guanine-N(7)-)-methyltransferase n=1 Tax=Methylobacillus flagellatus (strain ATCC 51484 / DSM 6875 / VKM B-1610 / KT) TaxID=265072 RepID=TRMB_METFK|nr:tRNA (guanosine(46)-N7)-methyltransferase TrmB [Methylobacillus flagellatus]Q1H4T5.1 RecName: Full=tRNA (guanine-N(7)-)-methyltransferase; AltName: Full=tRNA (guanine(46)-N(7))-methyltransferase; AltName: Full=tRNA(m7G46)-methyltransferase [Methylobacillus flagellatus KT]ABE48502.1 tRNA (guanine-N(7)-)-methyltransferase [Methylobacillus flagellatus KT]